MCLLADTLPIGPMLLGTLLFLAALRQASLPAGDCTDDHERVIA